MKTIAFFNNKGGVGKTSLVYHLAHMLAEMGHRTVVADFDPQANLSGMCLLEDRLEEIWSDVKGVNEKTVDGNIELPFRSMGDISSDPYIEEVNDKLGLLVGDLELSSREDKLSAQWPLCLEGDEAAFRITTAFARLVANAGKKFESDLALLDVGPNLGAINRAALIASDYVVIPLAPDLFSLQGLRNVGPILRRWNANWRERIDKKPGNLEFRLPGGNMKPLGYSIMRHTTIRHRPVQAYLRWIEKMPKEYMDHVLEEESNGDLSIDNDTNCLAHLKDYRSLMPLAQEASKPMFALKPADGVIGAQQNAVLSCYKDFHTLAEKILDRIGEAK